MAKRLAPFEMQLRQLDTIPGINQRIAQIIVAEVGLDMSRFINRSLIQATYFLCWAA